MSGTSALVVYSLLLLLAAAGGPAHASAATLAHHEQSVPSSGWHVRHPRGNALPAESPSPSVSPPNYIPFSGQSRYDPAGSGATRHAGPTGPDLSVYLVPLPVRPGAGVASAAVPSTAEVAVTVRGDAVLCSASGAVYALGSLDGEAENFRLRWTFQATGCDEL